MTTPPDVPALDRLGSDLTGSMILPPDTGYDEARRVFLSNHDRRPAAVVRVAGDDDVRRVVGFAADTGMELAVRSGGHSAAGHGTTDGGIVLDLADLTGLDIDVAGRTAWAQTGLTAGAYTAAAAEHGLGTGFGDTADVGTGGLTTAGGIGFLVRKHGLTIDSLLAAEVVTADGALVRTDAETEPDLFWAIRGGGGNFGVATRFRYKLHDLETCTGGMLVLPATAEVVSGFIAAAADAPEELSTILNVMTAPPMPFLPEELHGKPVVLAFLFHSGQPGAGEAALAPFRALASPLADMLKPMSYPEIVEPVPEGFRPANVVRTQFLDRLEDDAVAAVIDRLPDATSAMAVVQVRVLGGAIARVPVDATAFAHRQRKLMVNVVAIDFEPGRQVEHVPWVTDLAATLRGDQVAGAYIGFLEDEGEERVRAAYPNSTWDRLVEVKQKYDPGNLFRLNANIPPGG